MGKDVGITLKLKKQGIEMVSKGEDIQSPIPAVFSD